jgi:broad specificity phosphatase PhoE
MTEEKTILFVRHAQSIYNMKHLFCGHTDSELSNTGEREVELLTNTLKNLNIAKSELEIYSSPLKRCLNTIKPYSDSVSKLILQREELIEINFGEWEGKTQKEVFAGWREQYLAWLERKANMQLPSGDSLETYADSLYRYLLSLLKNSSAKYIIVCTHSTPVRIIASKTLVDDLSLVPALDVKNSSITVIKYRPAEAVRMKLDSYNLLANCGISNK